METFIWAIGSTFILMLILILLPLGFSKKGKFFIIAVSFVLALGGLGAITVIPLWETAMLLTVLIFFVSYIMDSRLDKLLYKGKPTFEEEFIDFDDKPSVNNMRNNDDNLVEISQSDILEVSPVMNVNSDLENDQINLQHVVNEDEKDQLSEINDEEVSLLLVREEEPMIEKEKDEVNSEDGYLADIESILLNETTEGPVDNWLDELVEMDELSPIESENKQSLEEELDVLPDIEIAVKEAAVAIAEVDNDEPLKVISK